MIAGPIIERIEFITFEFEIENMTADPAGFGVAYTPGITGKHIRFGLRIFTDTGVVGEYVPGRSRVAPIMAAAEALASRLLGKPALSRIQHYNIMRRLTKHIGEVGIGALDIALWDLAGKHHGASVSTLLGGYRDRLPAYASTLGGDEEADGLSTPEAYADFAEQCYEMGYRAYKMHGWHEGNVAREAALLEAVAKRVGHKMTIMYDASNHLRTLADAIELGRVCDACGLYWFEDPYGDGGISVRGHQSLKKFVKTPILITEHIRNLETTVDMLVAGASDFARADPDYDCGITGCYKLANAAEGLGIDTEVHSCGPAMRQLMSACRNSNFYEVNLVHPRMPNAWSLPYYKNGYHDQLDCIEQDGTVVVPGLPGMGVEYDWDAIEATSVEKRIVK